jgi:hypothetical protein
MHLICAPMLAKFYSCKKWVLHVLTVNNAQLIALLGSGSTHNLIDNTAVSRACVILATQHGLRVTVAKGDKLHASGCYRNMAIAIHGEKFCINYTTKEVGSKSLAQLAMCYVCYYSRKDSCHRCSLRSEYSSDQ